MGIFSRFMDIVNSNINSLLDKAEDPEKMLRLMIQEMEDTLIELKSTCSAKMAQGIRLERKLKETENTLQRWQNRAELAVSKGKEDLAREALLEKRHTAAELDRIKAMLDDNAKQVEEGKTEIHTLEDKLSQAKAKFQMLKEKEDKARMDGKTSFDRGTEERFQRMEERIDRMNAWNDLGKESSRSAEDRFRDLERDEEIEAELNELKKKAEN